MRLYLLAILCFGATLLAGCTSFEGQYEGRDAGGDTAGEGGAEAGSNAPVPEQAPAARNAPVDPFQDALNRIEQARNLPVPEGNYMVQVERVWFAESESTAISAMLGYMDENIAVQVGSQSPDAGFRVGGAKGGFFGALDGHMRSSRGTSREQIMLTMVADFPAMLAIGQTRYMIPFTVGGVQYGMLVPEGQFVGTSLEAICTPVGEGRIQVQLTPVFSGLGRGGETVRVSEATTTVVLPKGQPLLIASQNQSRNNVATSLLSRRTERGNEQAVLIVTVN